MKSPLFPALLIAASWVGMGSAIFAGEPLQQFDAQTAAHLKAQQPGDGQDSKKPGIYTWLAPFYLELKPYARPPKMDDAARWMWAKSLSELIKPALLPNEWQHRDFSFDASPRSMDEATFKGEIFYFDEMPSEILPLCRQAKTSSARIWQHRSGTRTIWVLNSCLYHVIVIGDPAGFGIKEPTEDDLVRIRDEFVHFPTKNLTLPDGWTSKLKIQGREGRFVWGKIEATGNKEQVSMTTWGNAADFFFDGTHFALRITQRDRAGRPVTYPN